MTMTAPLPEVEEESEERRVIIWRKKRLVDAGYSMELASLIGTALYVDLHEAERLLALGADPHVAAKILL